MIGTMINMISNINKVVEKAILFNLSQQCVSELMVKSTQLDILLENSNPIRIKIEYIILKILVAARI